MSTTDALSTITMWILAAWALVVLVNIGQTIRMEWQQRKARRRADAALDRICAHLGEDSPEAAALRESIARLRSS